jgi:hypothetical protein
VDIGMRRAEFFGPNASNVWLTTITLSG